MDDADLAREMTELSVEEREKVYNDIHGVAQVREETPAFIDECLEQLNAALERLPAIRRKNYNRALLLWPGLATDQAFRLMFLRAEEYDARAAATRLTKYYDFKRDLFGEEKLVKRITIDDLTEEDLYVIRCGLLVVLPFKDQSGRPLIFSDESKLDLNRMSKDNLFRCHWYMTLGAVMHNPEGDMAQKTGICCIVHAAEVTVTSPALAASLLDIIRGHGRLLQSLPVRYAGYRICYDDPNLEYFIRSMQAVAGKFIRLRVQTHRGSNIEHDYFLMSLGVPCPNLMQNSHSGDTTIHEDYIRRRMKVDNELDEALARRETRMQVIAYPSSNDVLIGRGAPYQIFPGTVQWNKLVHAHLDRYTACTENFEKTVITMQVVQEILHQRKGRFLQRTNTGWKILDEPAARLKAASAFRTRINPTTTTIGGSKPSPLERTNENPMGEDLPQGGGNAAKRPRTV